MTPSENIVCNSCGASSDKARLPVGWKRQRESVWCADCWNKLYVLRAITIPVAGPVSVDGEDADWTALRVALKTCWASSTRLSNWVTSRLWSSEPPRTGEKMPKREWPYLYPEAAGIVPDMDPTSRQCCIQNTTAKYRARRYHAYWLCAESTPNFRYPVPYPFHCDTWSLSLGEDKELLASLRMAGRRWTLRLRGGHDFARQRSVLVRVAAGEHKQGEAAIYQRRTSTGDHRPSVEGRAPSRLMLKLCVWLPRTSRESEGTLYVRTGVDAFWTYRVGENGEPHYLRADHVRRWIAEHRSKLDHMADDTKFEKRWPKRMREQMDERVKAWCRKQHKRMDSFTHESTAMLAAFAERRKVASVLYDDRDQGFAAQFPWAELRTKLEYKLRDRSIGITFASAEVVDGPADVLAEKEGVE